MNRVLQIILAATAYLATGIFLVPANEKAVVRRFGRVVTPAYPSGIHLECPWPFCRIDRVNFNEVRTLSLGDIEADSAFLQSTSTAGALTYLTGDKNLLLLRIAVHYRVSEEFAADWLYRSESPVQQLQSMIEATVGDFVSQSGVDFVHTLGLSELNNRLLKIVRHQSLLLHLGCEIEQVTIDRVEPPARVKAEFLDVSNARADMARSIHEAKGYAEQKLAASQADTRKITDTFERDRMAKMSAAQASADRFQRFVAQIRLDAESSGRSYQESRQLVMNRLTLESIRDVLERTKLKVMLDGETPVDLALPK